MTILATGKRKAIQRMEDAFHRLTPGPADDTNIARAAKRRIAAAAARALDARQAAAQSAANASAAASGDTAAAVSRDAGSINRITRSTVHGRCCPLGRKGVYDAPKDQKLDVAGRNIGALAGGIYGAETGAAIGTMICPGAGTVVGGLVGGAVGAVAGSKIGSSIVSGGRKPWHALF
ncbi:hypothetical protein ACIOJE_39555 [Kitasatospora sp. NPDC087861]|uniref:hypothetical protein n=1 Tax=Kitasatospora sp. NPDC087861 TaxID=3364070 RepID=UPI0038259262